SMARPFSRRAGNCPIPRRSPSASPTCCSRRRGQRGRRLRHSERRPHERTFEPNSTVPAPAGSYVIHYGGKIHFDGAKDEETVIQVWGHGAGHGDAGREALGDRRLRSAPTVRAVRESWSTGCRSPVRTIARGSDRTGSRPT